MKQILFFILFATLFVACDKNPKEDNVILEKGQTFKIIQGACGSIMYKEKIGDNFDAALDSLIKIREPIITAEAWGDGYYIEKGAMKIDFNYDDRTFYSIGFIDNVQNFHVFSLTDVIDSKGNYFVILWCED